MSALPITTHPALQPVTPDAIAAGIGVMKRRELCGLLALLEVTAALEIAKGAVAVVQEKLGRDFRDLSTRLKQRAEGIEESKIPDDSLRHRLWTEVSRALGVASLLPLSSRSMREASAAIAVGAAEILSPLVLKRRQALDAPEAGIMKKAGDAFDRILSDPKSVFTPTPTLSFPDIVAEEAFQILRGLQDAARRGQLDPAAKEAVEAGQAAAMKAALAGGGWIAFASLVQVAGFAPYILAAQASAFIPFVGGPAVVSFLAVIVNPVTLVAGLMALGYWGVHGQANKVRSIAAARIATILSLHGLGREAEGVAALVNAFRHLPEHGPAALTHLPPAEAKATNNKISQLNSIFKNRLPAAFPSPVAPWSTPIEVVHTLREAEVPLVAALTLGDLVYHAAAIDPKVLAAADFSRTLEIGTSLDFAANIGAFLSEGAQTNLRGYTAEQIVAAHYIDAGCAVEIPATSNMPGYDLLIDGSPVQVKCGAGLDLLQTHFEKYPNIPVVANSELLGLTDQLDAPFRDMVTSFSGFDLSSVEGIMDGSLKGAEGLADADVPLFAALVGAGRGAYRAWRGEILVEDLPAWLLVELAARGALAAGGKLAGGFVGLLVIGPAGAVVLSPLLGIVALYGIGSTKAGLERQLMRAWHDEVLDCGKALHVALNDALSRRRKALLDRIDSFGELRSSLPLNLFEWLISKSAEDAIYATESLEEIRCPSKISHVSELLIAASKLQIIDPATARARRRVLDALCQKPLMADALQDRVSRIWRAVGAKLRQA